jgi:hypothetical protein
LIGSKNWLELKIQPSSANLPNQQNIKDSKLKPKISQLFWLYLNILA